MNIFVQRPNLKVTPLLLAFCILFVGKAFAADDYSRALNNFSHAKETKQYIQSAYGYALLPTVGKAGFGLGAAYGKGRVYKQGEYTGNTSLTQVSVGFQIGGQAYSEIIFFKNKSTYDNFVSGNVEFNAQVSAVAINFGASAQAGTTGNSAGAGQSGGVQTAAGDYVDGMAVFTAAKGGLMLEASVAGQSFTFEPK